MKKIALTIAAGLLILSMLIVSAGAVCMPFPGTDILSVYQDGVPAAGTSLDLYRVNPFGGKDTCLGTYLTDDTGRITASHLTTGSYYWKNAETIMESFKIIGAGYVYTEIELPVIQPDNATEDGREHMTYMSADGYQIRYNALCVESWEIDEHTAKFVILGEPDGKNSVTVSWIADKQPEEVLYEVTFPWADDPLSIQRHEGLFPGTDDKWGYWRMFIDPETGVSKCAIAGEYNEGVLLFEIESWMTGNDEEDMTISDTLSGIIDSITYFEFSPQTMYSYIPGVYELTEETGEIRQVILNEDHTGMLVFQNQIEILWGSTELIAPGSAYSYTIEGENLYLDLDGEWLCFEKKS